MSSRTRVLSTRWCCACWGELAMNPCNNLYHRQSKVCASSRLYETIPLPPMAHNMEVLISREQIADGVARIGQEITREFAGETVILLGVLKGACLFLSD